MKIKLILGFVALMLSSLAFAEEPNLNGPGSLPVDPEVGQCYVHKFFPPVYNSTEETVLVKEEYTYYTKTPAVIGTETISHAFATPGSYQISDPVFETETVQILIRPDDPVWSVNCCDKKPPHPHKRGFDKNEPCEEACFDAVRPIYKTYVVQRTVTDGSYVQQTGGIQNIQFEVPVVITPATITPHTVPAEYMTFTVYTLEHPGYMKWVEGTCKDYTCDPKVLQTALAELGYYKGNIDGIIGSQTVNALNSFRADKGLGIHDKIDAETAKALGIE